ncbi:MAG: MmgE/PrpD family protein [Actinomycetota bacterium]|nr:MmgE/PrpD family protein [Actinomycetota bacterium]
MTSLVQELAELAVRWRTEPLDEQIAHATTRVVVDWMAATLAGVPLGAPGLLTAVVAERRSAGGARLATTGASVDPCSAALVNGTAAHVAELDDIYRDGLYHPGAPTIAAALALLEDSDGSGEELVRAVIAGFEVGCRLAAAVNPTHYVYWHTTGTVGTLGAAAAGAVALGLGAEGVAHALATAATMAAGLQQAFRSDAMSKPLHSGRAAEGGTLAALAAKAGVTGALDVLEGEAGFFAAMSTRAGLETVLADPGRAPCVTRPTVKSHSCCGHAFAPVDGALELRAGGLDWNDVAAVKVETYAAALKVAGIADPRSPFEAKFSIPYCVASALVRGGVRLSAFTEEACADADVRAVMGRVHLSVEPDLDAHYPQQRAARLTAVCRDGRRLVSERSTRKGDPDDPLSDAELWAKFSDLTGAQLGASGAADLLGQLRHLPDVKRLRDMAWTGHIS